MDATCLTSNSLPSLTGSNDVEPSQWNFISIRDVQDTSDIVVGHFEALGKYPNSPRKITWSFPRRSAREGSCGVRGALVHSRLANGVMVR